MQRNLNILHCLWECDKLNWLVSIKKGFYLAHILPSLSTAKETSIRDSTEKMKSNQTTYTALQRSDCVVGLDQLLVKKTSENSSTEDQRDSTVVSLVPYSGQIFVITLLFTVLSTWNDILLGYLLG